MVRKIIAGVLGALALSVFACAVGVQAQKHNYKPKEGYVPDEITAVKIAEAVLVPIYGEDVINKERPFKAVLGKGVWIVTGTLPCPEGNRCVGGVAEAEISKQDATVLLVSHGK